MRLLTVCFLCVGLMSAQAEDEGYVLAKEGWHIPIGMKIKVDFSRDVRKAKMKMMFDEGWITGSMNGQDRGEMVGERTAKGSYLLSYGKVVSKYLMFVRGEKSKQVEVSPLSEKVVQVDFKDEAWKAKVIKGDVDGVDPDKLAERIRIIEESISESYSEQFYGFAPRKVGETWEVEKPVLPGMEGIEVLEGKAKVTFQKVGEFKDHQCAYLQVEFDVTTKYTEGGAATMQMMGKGTIIRSLDHQLDLQFKTEGRMVADAELEGETRVKTDGKFELSHEGAILPKSDE